MSEISNVRKGQLYRAQILGRDRFRYVRILQVRRPVGARPYAIAREVSPRGRRVKGTSRLGVDRRLKFRIDLFDMGWHYELVEPRNNAAAESV